MEKIFIFEVNLSVDLDRAAEFAHWLPVHLEQMLQFPGFLEAHWFDRIVEADSAECVHWTLQYRTKDRASIDMYLTQHAARMRTEGIKHFGYSFQASRRILIEHVNDRHTIA